VVNTHVHPDHLGGNKLFKGAHILAGGYYTKEDWIKEAGEEGMPTDWLKGERDIKMGDETVTLMNLEGNTHTASDVVVYLHKRKMLFAGDVILNQQVPAMMGVADPAGYFKAFDLLPKKFVIEKIVPGHGSVGGLEVLDKFKQYFVDMEMASKDEAKREDLEAKYKDWVQVPLIMSTGATIRVMKEKAAGE
jgi:glyoxylase-like metal-dependent hydrolase (beta-lactamase superfamily II)